MPCLLGLRSAEPSCRDVASSHAARAIQRSQPQDDGQDSRAQRFAEAHCHRHDAANRCRADGRRHWREQRPQATLAAQVASAIRQPPDRNRRLVGPGFHGGENFWRTGCQCWNGPRTKAEQSRPDSAVQSHAASVAMVASAPPQRRVRVPSPSLRGQLNRCLVRHDAGLFRPGHRPYVLPQHAVRQSRGRRLQRRRNAVREHEIQPRCCADRDGHREVDPATRMSDLAAGQGSQQTLYRRLLVCADRVAHEQR